MDDGQVVDILKASEFIPLSIEHPPAWVGHIPFAAWLVKQYKPSVIVELGTHSANSYFAFCQSVKENNVSARCYAIDTWEGDQHAGHYGNEIYEKVEKINSEHFGSFSRLMRMTFDQALESFEDASINLLHIDGLHTYEAVKEDFYSWLPKMAKGGIVLFHDINVKERGFGVYQLWQEIKDQFCPLFEFEHSHGLGVLCISDNGKNDIPSCLPTDPVMRDVLKSYFAQLGERQRERYEHLVCNVRVEDLVRAHAEVSESYSRLKQVVEQLEREKSNFMEEQETKERK